MNDTQALEKRLAELLGYTDIDGYTGLYEGFYKTLPRWTADDAAAFQLMIAYDCYPVDSYGFGTDGLEDYIDVNWAEDCDITVNPKDYASKSEAIRVAIVKAVIAKLEAAQ